MVPLRGGTDGGGDLGKKAALKSCATCRKRGLETGDGEGGFVMTKGQGKVERQPPE